MANSRIFDFISDRGHRIAERRAYAANPALAEREARRRDESNGAGILISGGGHDDITVETFFADRSEVYTFRPWWLKVTLHIHWWLQEWGPRAIRFKVVKFWQRGRRGWADSDTWSLDNYLAYVIRDSVTYLHGTVHTRPASLTFEEWKQVLSEIAEGMDAHLNVDLWGGEDAYHEMAAKRAKALEHLAKHWDSLWD